MKKRKVSYFRFFWKKIQAKFIKFAFSPKQNFQYTSFDVQTDRIRIHAGHWIPSEKKKDTTLICLHGITANHLAFSEIAGSLAKMGMDVIAPDLRGRGRSERPMPPNVIDSETGQKILSEDGKREYGVDIHIQDLHDFIRKTGRKKISLAAHSFGCFVAVGFTVRYPELVEKLVIIDGGGKLSVPQKLKALSAIKPSLSRLGKIYASKEDYFESIKNKRVLRSWTSNMEKYFTYELEDFEGGVRNTVDPLIIEAELDSMGGSIETGKLFAGILKKPTVFLRKLKRMNILEFEKIKCPVLVIRAGRFNQKVGDDVLPLEAAKEMQQKIKDCKVYTIDDMNHFEVIMNEDPDRDKTIYEFL